MEEIRYANNMSPRSKENAVNRLRIEHLLEKVDTAIQKRIANDLMQEREEEYLRSQFIDNNAAGVSDSIILSSKKKKSTKIMTAVDKLTIIQSEKNEMTK